MRRRTVARESTEVRKGAHMTAKEATTVTPTAPSVASYKGSRRVSYEH